MSTQLKLHIYKQKGTYEQWPTSRGAKGSCPPIILEDIAQVYYNARSALDLMVLLPPPKKRFKIFVAAYEMFPL